jgi:DNA-binding winged helix-turn-helix (wHTH) protein
VTTRIFKFGEFEVDLGRYELRRSGRAVKLEKIPMELLILMAERRGQLITREEIIQKLWGENVFVDTRQGINTAIRKIRLALKDDPEQPRILETIVGKGYRLAAPVTVVDSASQAAVTPEVIPAHLGESTTAKAAGPISPLAARSFFLFIQVGYLIMYAAAFIYLPNIQRLGLPTIVPVLTLVVGLVGTAARIYLLASVAVRFAKANRLFRQMFPGTLVLDILWSASPLLLYHKLGELTLIFVAAMVFLPFAQRTLMFWTYGEQ